MNILNIKYNEKIFTNKNALGKIFRIFNKQNKKSYIDSTDTNMLTVYNIIKELNSGIFNNNEMQNDWIKNFNDFEAEDLQFYYTKSELPILIINWKKFFGGENYQSLYKVNNFNENEYKDIDAILEENKHYTYYIDQLLKINHQLKDQINVLNENYKQLQLYDIRTQSDLSTINNLILKQINQYPIQTLQMLTSLLSITSAECNKQFNNLSNFDKEPYKDIKVIDTNTNTNINTNNNIIDINTNTDTNIDTNTNIDVKVITQKPILVEKNLNNDIDKKVSDKKENEQNIYNKINSVIQMIQQYIPTLKQAIKNIKNNQYVTIYTKDKVNTKLIDIQQLFNRTTEQMNICKNDITQLNDSIKFNNIMNKLTKQLQNLRNDFITIKNNIINRIKRIDAQNNAKIDTQNLSTEELMNLKLQRSTDNNEITFKFFNGLQPINNWLRDAYRWLVDNDYEPFAQELQYEVNKSIINKSPSKSLAYLINHASGKNYDEIANQFNVSKTIIIRNMDSLQQTHPAIYLAFGYGSKTSSGRAKRVLNILKNRGITKIPPNF